MANELQIRNPRDAQAFLASFDGETRRRGYRYYQQDAVRSLTCLAPGTHYQVLVQGSRLYETTLMYEGGGWASECTCPVQFDCKHAYAAMMALLAASPGNQTAMPAQPAAPASKPAAGLLEQELARTLGRDLRPEERRLAMAFQKLFHQYRSYRGITVWDLQRLFPSLHSMGWQLADWWPAEPRDEVEFCRFLIFGLHERRVPLPDFLVAIADLPRIGKIMAQHRRREEISRWQSRLQSLISLPAGRVEGPMDFRLMVGPLKAVLECKAPGDPAFQKLKVQRLKELRDLHANGGLDVVPEAFPIWHAMAHYDRWGYQQTNALSYDDQGARRVLRALIQAPALRDRIVTFAGEPFDRPAGSLRWHLQPAATTHDDYHLRLVAPDGSPPPPIHVVLEGQPPLYVTDSAILTGPAPWQNRRETEQTITIPAPALESREGVGFLVRLGVELPPRLRDRVRRVALRPKIVCKIEPTYPGSRTEVVLLRVVAENASGQCREVLTSTGWLPDLAPPKKQAGKQDDAFIVYDRDALTPVPQLLSPLGLKWDGYAGRWRLRVTKKFPELFVPWLASLPKTIEVRLDSTLATLTQAPVKGEVRLESEPAGIDWFDLKVVLNVSDTELTPEELNALLNARGGYVRLGEKGWRRLEFDLTEAEDERLARLGLNPRDFSSEPQRLHALQLADDAAAALLPQEQVLQIQRRAEEIKTRVTPDLPKPVRAELRPYQVEGFHFLAYLSTNRFGGILADDMGLGKTLQTLTWLAWLRAQDGHARRPTLVVCPKSVMDNWRAEAERFVSGLRVHLWRGTDPAALTGTLQGADVLVVNYAQLRALSDALAGVPWLAAILDEGQYIKNPESQTARAARALKADHRLVLTGTPIENRLLDLWSLMAFAMPGVLGQRAQFGRLYDQAEDPLARRRLSSRVRPFVLRRTKGQVARELPDRVEEDLMCDMEGEQRTLYNAELKHAQQMLLKIKTKQDLDQNRFNFLTSLLRLRQICCHPALVNPQRKDAFSAKLDALMDLLEPLMEEGHKVLVFSQFVTLLDLLRPVLQERNWPHFYLTGGTENRGELIKSFQATEGAAVFLLSLKAGGFGLNLTAASYVVLFDPWWNPAVEAQAIDRTHRIGQTSKVIAYRLLIKGSVEDKIRALQRQKKALAADVLGEESFASSLTMEDLQFLFSGEVA